MNTEEFSNQSSSPLRNNEETIQPTRIRLSADDLEHFTKEEIIKCWLDQDKYLDNVEGKNSSAGNENNLVSSESEDRYRQQLADAARRENLLVMRLTTKEQEMQDLLNQVNELKATQTPSLSALRSHLLDPAVNLMLDKLKRELDATKTKLEETQNELSAWKFTPDSNTGKRLMAKCRMLYQENEELGKMISSGRLAKLEGDLALQKNFSEEMKKSQTELDEVLQELDEDMEGMQSTILHLQQQLRECKEQINNLTQDNEQLHQHVRLGGQQVAAETNDKDNEEHECVVDPDSEEVNSATCDPPANLQWSLQQNGHSAYEGSFHQRDVNRSEGQMSCQNGSEDNSECHISESDEENVGSTTADSMDESSQSELVSSSKDQAANPCDQTIPNNTLSYNDSSIGNSIDGVSCDGHHGEEYCRTSSIASEPDQPDSSNCKSAQDNVLSSAIAAEPDSQPAGSALLNHKRTTRSSNSRLSESTVTSAEKGPVSSTNIVRKRTIYETGDSRSDSLPRRSKRTRTDGNGSNPEPDDGSSDILSNGLQSSLDE